MTRTCWCIFRSAFHDRGETFHGLWWYVSDMFPPLGVRHLGATTDIRTAIWDLLYKYVIYPKHAITLPEFQVADDNVPTRGPPFGHCHLGPLTYYFQNIPHNRLGVSSGGWRYSNSGSAILVAATWNPLYIICKTCHCWVLLPISGSATLDLHIK